MASYTERFTEGYELLAHIPADSETVEQNTAFLDCSNFHRVFVLISVGDIAGAGTFDVDVEQAQDSAGTGVKNITGKSIAQLVAADDDVALAIELRMEELDVDNDFNFIRVELTPAVGAVEFAVFVFGFVHRFAPPATTPWEEIVD